MFSFLNIIKRIILWIPFRNIVIRVFNKFRWKGDKYYRNIFDEFKKLVKNPVSKALVDFIDQRTLKDLNYLQLKCKEEEVGRKGIKEPQRVLQFLNNEIHRRIQVAVILISTLALVVSLMALRK